MDCLKVPQFICLCDNLSYHTVFSINNWSAKEAFQGLYVDVNADFTRTKKCLNLKVEIYKSLNNCSCQIHVHAYQSERFLTATQGNSRQG